MGQVLTHKRSSSILGHFGTATFICWLTPTGAGLQQQRCSDFQPVGLSPGWEESKGISW